MPARIVFTVAGYSGFLSALLETVELSESFAHFAFVTHNSNQILHGVLQIFLHLVRTFAVASIEWSEGFMRDAFDFVVVDFA